MVLCSYAQSRSYPFLSVHWEYFIMLFVFLFGNLFEIFVHWLSLLMWAVVFNKIFRSHDVHIPCNWQRFSVNVLVNSISIRKKPDTRTIYILPRKPIKSLLGGRHHIKILKIKSYPNFSSFRSYVHYYESTQITWMTNCLNVFES